MTPTVQTVTTMTKIAPTETIYTTNPPPLPLFGGVLWIISSNALE